MRIGLLLLAAACSNDVALGGPGSLVRVDAELPGANCPAGGVAILSGLDTNGDGYLQDGEVTSTQYVCNGQTAVECGDGVALTGTIAVASDADLAQLAGVNCVDGDVLIAGLSTDTMPDLPLATVTGGIVIAGNPNLTSLGGLGQLREVGGTVLVQGNDSLVDVGALGNLTRVNAINIVGNDALTDLAGLSPLRVVHGSVTIADNPSLASLHGMENITAIDDSFLIRSNRALTSLAGLDGLHAAGLIEVSGSDRLTDLGLTNLEKVDVRLTIATDPALTSAALPQLSAVGDFVRFDTDGALTSIDLPALLSTGSLQIVGNTTLATMTASRLAFASKGIDLTQLPALTHVDLTAVSAIGNELHVIHTPKLVDLTGLASLRTIGGEMTLQQADGLTSFHGLDQLTLVSGNVTITDNASLASFSGLGSLSEIGGSLTISNNPKLAPATSTAWANGVSVHGSVTIH
jgi:hypothetical protein